MGTERKMVDSGVDWIGEVPEGWDATALKNILSLSRERTTGNDFYVGMENISSGSGRLISGEDARTVENGIDSAFRKGDILFGKLRPYLRKVWMADRDGSCSTEFLVMDSGAIETNRFLFYTLLTDEFCSLVNNNCKGVKMPRADWENIGSTPVVLPPLPEQQSIANFLDHHVGLIDRERELIAQKIGLLQDKRKALIFECVTGKRTIVEAQHLAGVDDWSDIVGSGSLVAVPTPGKDDPFVKGGRLVDSGVDWIGEVPEGWQCKRLKEVSSRHARPTLVSKNDEHHEGGTPVITPGELASPKDFYVPALRTRVEAEAASTAPRGSVAVANIASIGKIRFLEEDSVCNPQVVAYSTNCMDPRFFYYSLFFVMDEASRQANTTTISFINTTNLGNIPLPFPKLETQKEIGAYLDSHLAIIDSEGKLLQTKSSLLADKRKSLIFEAVTGKIDCTQP